MEVKYYLAKLVRKLFNPKAIKNSQIHKCSKICYGSNIVNCNIDKYTYVGDNSNILNCKIGAFSSIASRVEIGGSSHPIDWVSTSPVFCEGRNVLRKNYSKKEYSTSLATTIGNDVWIGSGAFIKAGLTIGDGAIIGMGAIVTKDVPAYSIVAGNPAKVIKFRQDKSLIEQLEKIKWWNFNETQLQSYCRYIDSPEMFINQVLGDKKI